MSPCTPVRLDLACTVHGDTGIEIHSYALPEPAVDVQTTHGVQLIIDMIKNEETGTVALVPTGPLANIALAARLELRIVERVKEVVLMGGGYHVGNWSAVAEFGIKIAPEAALMVFTEPRPVTIVGLDLTQQALATADAEEKVKALGTDLPTSSGYSDCLSMWMLTIREKALEVGT